MRPSLKRSIVSIVMALSLLVGQSAHAAFKDWFNFWPFASNSQKPSVGAQVEGPGGGGPAGGGGGGSVDGPRSGGGGGFGGGPGGGTPQFPTTTIMPSEKATPPMPPQSMEESPMNESQDHPRFTINPQQLKDMIRQTQDQQRELKRLLARAKRIKGAETLVGEIQSLLDKAVSFQQKFKTLKGEELQDAFEEFQDAQPWDTLNELRAKVELPQRIAEIQKSLKRVTRLIGQKTFQRLKDFGLNLDKIQSDISSIQSSLAKATELAQSGNAQDAQEELNDVFQGGHPGEIEGVLQQMRGYTQGLTRIRNAEIRAMVQEIFEPVIEAVNDGDYREANQLLNELGPEMRRIFDQLSRVKSNSVDDKMRARLDAFEQKIEEKLGGSSAGIEQKP